MFIVDWSSKPVLLLCSVRFASTIPVFWVVRLANTVTIVPGRFTGEGDIKFYLDGDKDFPTINGTGTEDYFNGSYDFENRIAHQYEEFTNPYSGLPQVIKPDGLYQSQQRFGLYGWHIPDPVRFENDLRVTIQDLGWREGKTYLPLMDDISSVAYWYQIEPHTPFPKLPARELLEIN